MNKKRWIVVSVAVVAFAIGVFTAGLVAGQETDSTGKSFFARVAHILGLDEQTVEDAMRQARDEIHSERIAEKLESLVESGALTQEQADEYQAWLESKPEGIYEFGSKRFGHKHRGWTTGSKLESLVESGALTQEQADEYQAWLESKRVFPKS